MPIPINGRCLIFKIKEFTLEQIMKRQRGCTDITILLFNLGAR
jgi:hypothetical protein